jgi:hypothetical protein
MLVAGKSQEALQYLRSLPEKDLETVRQRLIRNLQKLQEKSTLSASQASPTDNEPGSSMSSSQSSNGLSRLGSSNESAGSSPAGTVSSRNDVPYLRSSSVRISTLLASYFPATGPRNPIISSFLRSPCDFVCPQSSLTNLGSSALMQAFSSASSAPPGSPALKRNAAQALPAAASAQTPLSALSASERANIELAGKYVRSGSAADSHLPRSHDADVIFLIRKLEKFLEREDSVLS